MPVIDLGSVVGPQGAQGATGATGAQGLQGNPGPNQVTNQTSTNLIGVLQGASSKVSVKPVDSTPTANSTNLVSSGGVKTALDAVANSLANQIIIESLALPNTGSISPDTNATVTTTIPAKTGYAPVACLPGYSGDDQFCWVGCGLVSSNTQASATVRNVSSSADSGAPRVFIIYQKV